MEIKKNRILIVDDSELNRAKLTEILQHEYILYEAKDGESAIKLAQRHIPDLILLDIILPDIDGYQVLNALRKMDKTIHIPIIYITGLNNEDDEKKGLILGAIDYISKPFDDMIVKLRVQHQIRLINQLRTIERLSMIDQLTGIPNRRNFDNRLQNEWSRVIRDNTSIGLMMVDIDHFKEYNDTYGHQQGDIALRVVAEVMTKTLKRASDFAARWGGEEFAVLQPGADVESCLKIGKKICKTIEHTPIACEDGTVSRLTVSIGVNVYTPTQSCSIDEFIKKADHALYIAKNTGRNRVFLYNDAKKLKTDKAVEARVLPETKMMLPIFEGEVLLCEDNKVNKRIISEFIAFMGIKVTTAENGKEGIELIKSHQEAGNPFDLILMDTVMPVMGGLEAVAALVNLNIEIPVIMLTVDTHVAIKTALQAKGVTGHMTKPVTLKSLMQCLYKYFNPVDSV